MSFETTGMHAHAADMTGEIAQVVATLAYNRRVFTIVVFTTARQNRNDCELVCAQS